MATDTNQGKAPTTAEQMEASNARMHAESAIQSAENQLRAATHAADRVQAQKAVEAASAELDKVKEKYGWIFDWQKAGHDLQGAAGTAAAHLEGMAETVKKVTVAEAEGMLREAKTATDRVEAQKLLRMATEEAEKAQAAAQTVLSEVKKHIVQKGESLSLIAKHYTGDVHKWKELYEANKATVGNNPDLIQPGMELILPW